MAPMEVGCCEVKSERFNGVNSEEEELGFGSVRFTRGLGRKRIVISSGSDQRQLSRVMGPDSDQSQASLKRQRSEVTMGPNSDKSLLESLPQDLLIRVLCGVDHEDLQRLFFVSKSIKEAALIAKQSHFAFSTPKKIRAFRDPIDFSEVSCDDDDLDDIEPPNAPIQRKTYRESPWTKSKRKDLSSIAMALFT